MTELTIVLKNIQPTPFPLDPTWEEEFKKSGIEIKQGNVVELDFNKLVTVDPFRRDYIAADIICGVIAALELGMKKN